MQKPKGAANFLAGPYLDRRALLREDDTWHATARDDPDTLFILTRGTAQLVHTQPQPRIAFVSAEHPLVRQAEEPAMLLLGWYRETRCVLVEVDADVDPPADALPQDARLVAREASFLQRLRLRRTAAPRRPFHPVHRRELPGGSVPAHRSRHHRAGARR